MLHLSMQASQCCHSIDLWCDEMIALIWAKSAHSPSVNYESTSVKSNDIEFFPAGTSRHTWRYEMYIWRRSDPARRCLSIPIQKNLPQVAAGSWVCIRSLQRSVVNVFCELSMLACHCLTKLKLTLMTMHQVGLSWQTSIFQVCRASEDLNDLR